MTALELNRFIGLSIVDGINFCEENGFKVEIWPVKAEIINMFKPRTVRFWHNSGIIEGWTMGSPWDLEQESVPHQDRT